MTREMLSVGERIPLARGGVGGRGNFHFRSSVNTTPREYEEGKPGERFTLRLELKLIADVGLVGLPNAGKSSLLNELTRARSKVANYPFTTLEPNLGAHYDLILADIPGLIEGASSGKGLGIRFLRHIERTRILFHLVSAESEHPVRDYKTVKNELKTYSRELAGKFEYVFLSKGDAVSPKDLKKKLRELKKINPRVLPISIHDWDSMEKVRKILGKIQDRKSLSI
jgi:GTP-binding protein